MDAYRLCREYSPTPSFIIFWNPLVRSVRAYMGVCYIWSSSYRKRRFSHQPHHFCFDWCFFFDYPFLFCAPVFIYLLLNTSRDRARKAWLMGMMYSSNTTFQSMVPLYSVIFWAAGFWKPYCRIWFWWCFILNRSDEFANVARATFSKNMHIGLFALRCFCSF